MEIFASSADSRKGTCQLLVKEWALNTDKLPLVLCLLKIKFVYNVSTALWLNLKRINTSVYLIYPLHLISFIEAVLASL